MAETNINIEMLQKGKAEFYEFEPNALVFKKQWVAAATVSKEAMPQAPQVHVFSGVVSSGVVGSTATFTPRPDDLIENAAELTTASHNNLAPFIAAIGNRLSYTIKIVPSVKSASGFTQRGTVQKIISGYNKNGTPKYKQVVNKFAIMDIYVKTDKGSQAHITTIVLGPVDSVRFQAANVDMTAVATSVQQNIIAPASAITPPAAPIVTQEQATAKLGMKVLHVADGNQYFLGAPNGMRSILGGTPVTIPGIPVIELTMADITVEKMSALGINGYTSLANIQASDFPGIVQASLAMGMMSGAVSGPAPTVTPTQPAIAPVVAPVAPKATTLFEYYQTLGQSLPSVEERSKLYEQLMLGQAAYYTGTAEQNTKLLAALQGARL